MGSCSALPDAAALDEFKNQVRLWMELDNSLRQLQQLCRERRTFKKQITEKITAFMSRYNIDDLHTKEGRLFCKTTYVKSKLTHGIIRQRIEDVLSHEYVNDPEKCTAITSAVFSRDRSQRASLTLRKVRVSSE
jgi:hypothetical protein